MKKIKINIWIFFYCFLFKEFVGMCESLSCNMNEMCKYKRYFEDKIVDCVFLGCSLLSFLLIMYYYVGDVN